MSSEKTDWSKSLDQEVSVNGMAQNAKAGALLMTGPEDAILIQGLAEWDEATVGKKVSLEAIVRRIPGHPKAGAGKNMMQGTAGGGDIWVLELKDYEVID